MSHIDPGPLASYDSLSDPNLTAYFNNSRMRKHLIKSGLVTRRGQIVSEKVFRLNNARKEHQRHVRDLLAQSIVHKALDMERHRQMNIKRQLEEIGKVERVRRVRADRALRGDEDILPLLSPNTKKGKRRRPMTAPNMRTQEPEEQLPASVGYPAIPGDQPYNTRSSRMKTAYPNVEVDTQHLDQLDQEALRSFTLNLSNYDLGSGVSPYTVPVLDPASREALPEMTKPIKKKKKRSENSKSSPKRTTSKSTLMVNRRSLLLHRREPPMIHRSQPRTMCVITFKYLGHMVHLDCEKEDPRDEVSVLQQHCGGENLCVYNGKLLPGDNFTVISQRHRNFPFSLTFYLNGIQAERLSTCCEYKHRKGHKLGAKTSHFGFVNIKGAHPCYRCLLTQGQLKTRPSESNPPNKQGPPWRKRRQPKPPSRGSYDDDFEQESKKTTDEDKGKSGSSLSSSSDESDISSISTLTGSKSPTDRSNVTSPKPTKQSPPPPSSSKAVTSPKVGSPKVGSPKIGSPKIGSPKIASPKSTPPRSASPPVEVDTSPVVSPPAEEISSESSDSTKNPLVKLGLIKKKKSSSSSSSSSSTSGATSETEGESFNLHQTPRKTVDSITSLYKGLRSVHVPNIELRDDQISELCTYFAEDPASLMVETVKLNNCAIGDKSMSRMLDILARSRTNIKTFDISSNNLTSVSMTKLVKFIETTPVETLVLDDNLLSDTGIEALLQGLTSIHKNALSSHNEKKAVRKLVTDVINVAENEVKSDDSIDKNGIPTAAKASSLRSSVMNDAFPLVCLSLNRVKLGGRGITALVKFLSENPPLKSLHLNGNALSGTSMGMMWKGLGNGSNTELRSLLLQSNQINDRGMDMLSKEMEKTSCLERIDLTDNGITEAGAAHVVKFISGNERIRHVYISRGNSIKRKTIKKIRSILEERKNTRGK